MITIRRLTWVHLSVFLLAVVLSGPAVPAEKYKGFERGEALITAKELKELMSGNESNPVILAVAKPLLEYRRGHIPGAQNVWRPMYEPEIGDPWPYDGMILNRTEFQELARELGIDNDSTVIVYDHKYDATRLWWAFYLYGKTDVRVLDGGYDAWVAEGYDVNRLFAAKQPEPGNFVASQPKPGWSAQLGDLWRAHGDTEWNVWDTRSDAEWTGEEVKGNSTCGGRVPWARRLNWKHFKTKVNDESSEPTAFATASEVRAVIEEFGIEPQQHHIFYCQSGVRCTTDLFALYLMGYDPRYLHNYDGSWLEWSYHYCGEEVNPRPLAREEMIETNN